MPALVGAERNGAHDDAGEVQGGGERPGAHDAACHAPRMVFFAVALDHLGDLRHGGMVQPMFGGQGVALVHAHVERAVGGVGEAAHGVVELGRGHPHVEHHAGDAGHAGSGEVRRQVAETPVSNLNAGILERQAVRAGNRFGVSVDDQQVRLGGERGKNAAGVATAPERGIHVAAVGIADQRRRHFARHDGLVPGVVTIHGPWPPRRGGIPKPTANCRWVPPTAGSCASTASPRRARMPAASPYSMTSSSRCVTVESRRDLPGLLGRSRCAIRSWSAARRSRSTVPAC